MSLTAIHSLPLALLTKLAQSNENTVRALKQSRYLEAGESSEIPNICKCPTLTEPEEE
jgi:hypothetical protein